MSTTGTRPISIAIAALGGQGSGVLSKWIVGLAEANGYLAQSTSVPGVAQRTGATIYSIELFPENAIEENAVPVLALMPVPGDVDICIAAELMEAGRAAARGLVSPGLTTLIASDHRVYGITEKEALGDGRLDEGDVRDTLVSSARQTVMFDMNRAAEETGSVISAVQFGALAASDALPLAREAFEEVIRRSGLAVESNLAGFDLGFTRATSEYQDTSARPAALPGDAQETAQLGAQRLVDFQDGAYADLYHERLREIAATAPANDPRADDLMNETARYLALWMSYEDIIRVADLKSRSARFADIGEEVRAAPGQIWYAHEYFHPRLEEISDILPPFLGRWLASSKIARTIFGPMFRKGRVIRTGTLSGFMILRVLAGLRRWRPRSLRFQRESTAIEAWLARIKALAATNVPLATEVATCARLLKGYGDTHASGTANFNRIMEFVDDNNAGDASEVNLTEKVRQLRDAALADDEGETLSSEFAA